MTLTSMSPVRNPQHPPSTPLLDPPLDMNAKFSGYLPRGEETSFMMSGMTMSSVSLVRNPQHPPSTPLLDPPFLTYFQWQHFWRHLNWEELKFSGYLPWGKKTWFMTSGMTLPSMSPVRNPQRPPSTPLLDPTIPDILPIEISTRNFQGIFLGGYLNHP